MRGMVSCNLHGAGHELTEAKNRQLAREAAYGQGFDRRLVEVNIPVMACV